MDTRWVSVLMHRLKERESYLDARRKLSAPRGPAGPHGEGEKGDKPQKPAKGGGRGDAPK